MQTSLIVAALKKLLPIGLNMCSPADQELINLAKIRYSLVDMLDFIKQCQIKIYTYMFVKVACSLCAKLKKLKEIIITSTSFSKYLERHR